MSESVRLTGDQLEMIKEMGKFTSMEEYYRSLKR